MSNRTLLKNLFAVGLMIVALGGMLLAAIHFGATVGGASTRANQTIVPQMQRATPVPLGYVHEEQFGDFWPFTVEDGVVACEPDQRVLFVHDGVQYAVNGMAESWAESAGYADVGAIWRDNPAGFPPKIDLTGIIILGLALCR